MNSVQDHTENIIELDNVSYTYNGVDFVVKDITFSVHRGDYLGLIGPNGSGKTTLLKMMLGLLRPTHGIVKIFGKEPKDFHEWYKIGYVAQKATHFDKNFPATVEEAVAMGTYARRGLFHFPSAEDKKRVYEALEQVEMLEHRKERIGDLSGGQQQRVFIARALATKPEVVILDEPTVGVDATTQEQFYLLLRKLNKEFRLTLILVSHELNIVSREATEVACINQSLVCYTTPEELSQQGGIEKLYGKDLRYLLHDHNSKE